MLKIKCKILERIITVAGLPTNSETRQQSQMSDNESQMSDNESGVFIEEMV